MNAGAPHAVVLGAGPAGLAAAWELALGGWRVTVLEAQSLVGGLCATVERDGYRFDLGGHRIVAARTTLVQRLRALLPGELLERERASFIALHGKRYRYPLEAGELVRTLPRGLALRGVLEAALTTLRPPREPARSFEQWVRARFGPTLYGLFFEPYTRKLWGLDPSLLSADWAAERISLLNLADAGLRSLGLRHGGSRSWARRYLYPRLGMGSLFERLVQTLRSLGVSVHTAAQPTHLERSAQGRVRAVHYLQEGAPQTLSCDALFSTAPLGSLLDLLGEGAAEASALRFRAMRFLHLCLRGAGPVLGATWVYAPEQCVPFTRLQEPAERSPALVPEGASSVMIEVPCNVDDALWTMDDAALLAHVSPGLARLGYRFEGRVEQLFSSRSAHAYPVYELGYRARRDVLLARVERAGNVWTLGRQGLFRYVFMDTAMEMGFAAARAALRGERARMAPVLAVDQQHGPHEARSVLG